MLADFYGEVSDELEIVFVSSDRSPEDMISYMKEYHGDWYGVKGIPMVVVVRKDGTLITKYGRHQVIEKQPRLAVQEWNWSPWIDNIMNMN